MVIVSVKLKKWLRFYFLIVLVLIYCIVQPVSTGTVGSHGISDSSSTLKTCERQTKCDGLQNTSCLGRTLPYRQTKARYFHNDDKLNNETMLAFQSVPRCWTSVQTFLCTLISPKCDNDRVYLPSYDMCNSARHNCRIIENNFGPVAVPSFLNCSQDYINPDCGNEYHDLKFNSSSAKCKPPLTFTEDSDAWYPGIDGCGLQCNITLISPDDQKLIHNIIWYFGLANIFSSLVCFLTFRIDWKSANRFPAVGTFYQSICYIFQYLAWEVQFFFDKQSIVCRLDNTRRYSESSSPGSTPCILVFFGIYYFGIASLVWLVINCNLWYRKLKEPNTFKDFIEKYERHIFLAAFCVPVAPCVILFSINKIDSYPMLGICFVSSDWPIMLFFVVAPIILSFGTGLLYTILTFIVLIKAKNVTVSHLSKRRKRRETINRMLLRLGIYWICLVSVLIVVFFDAVIYHLNSDKWQKHLHTFVLCSLKLIPAFAPDRTTECGANVSPPSVSYLLLQLPVYFLFGFNNIIWLFTPTSWKAWRRFLLKKCDAYDRQRGRKHEMLAKAYTRRILMARYNQESLHGDPVDMNLTSATSQDISSEWANNLPKFLQRRGAVTEKSNANHYLPPYKTQNNNNSSLSEIYMQPMSYDNHHSLDSQASNDVSIFNSRHVRRKTKKERVRLRANKAIWKASYNNRESDSSVQGNNLALVGDFIRTQDAVTRATSTRDLSQLPGPSSMLPACNYLPPSFPLTPPSFAHPTAYPVMSPSVISRPRTAKPPSNHPFTHGMFQQSDLLINPLQERRRPDSKMDGHSVSPSAEQSASQQNHNLGVGFLNSFNCPVPMSGQPLGAFANPNHMVNGCVPPNGIPNYFGFSAPAVFQQQPLTPPIYNSYFPRVPYPGFSNGINNLDDLQNMNRAREACLSLITGVDTSEAEGGGGGRRSMLPIVVSDSEGFTDGASSVNRSTRPFAR